MKYQLVLQWPATSLRDFDALIEIEDVLVEKLSVENEVDGHDAGSGQINIFILTDRPQEAFNEVKAILGNRDFWTHARIAYRECAGEAYTILWPKGLAEFDVL